ncbi:MAG: glycosyltransferase family 2 protein [Bacteroidota bacterium]
MTGDIEISIIIPLYNEEAVFDKLIQRLLLLIDSSSSKIEIVLVDDGSTDETALHIQAISMTDGRFKGVFLSRNYGHQIALSAGMANVAASKAVMMLDGDLQDPPEMLSKFYEKIEEGYDVVYAVREKRKEGAVKRLLYWIFYRLLKIISDTNLPLDSGDFSMISRKVNDIIVSMPEQSRFVRGLRTWVGFKQIGIAYERDKRSAGESKYSFGKLFQLAYDGIFNFSFIPLKVITRLGFYTILISLLYLSFVLFKKFFGYPLPSGFTALIFSVSLFSGVQLISLGVLGEYISRIYLQVKNRPLYLVRKIIANKQELNG